ncbi:EF-hand domain-containing protein [Aspergillus udagawae]|uniref:SPARC/Testican calcium-binding domain-containing protein n=1 Tax=Aspergillus udagawae TaxID=91492 RepID=A0A8E0UXH7_9EURO|nr:uncharacterized protein Aud_002721 [Aspergillus udagawae]GIC86351.1 hypothetical protein Aud_002721 [Aspergillus udagawae]
MSDYTERLREHRDDLSKQVHELKELLRREAAKDSVERAERYQARGLCLQVVGQASPEDLYVSVNYIKSKLATFYIADRNYDGKLTIQELLSVYGPEQREEIEKFFKEKDVSRDQKLSLSEWFIIGVLGTWCKPGKPWCKQVKAE